ncbi:MAG TPA: isocitrate/isopropylmalate family dehydrogenase [Candidatus Polarisedimenticolia bacterium]|nr:isocitrate/isopropylmalate family dehydrogenase [Candidatus Polarisedimenticolia bacterium]
MTEPATGKALGHLKGARSSGSRVPAREIRHTVTLIPGDGIGEEVAEAVTRVVEASGAGVGWDWSPAGQAAMAKHGTPVPDELLESIRRNKVALKGRIRAPLGEGPHGAAESPNVTLRKKLNLFASIRPARNIPGLKSRYEGVDLIVIRENTEDVYAGIEHEVVPGVVESLRVVTEAASTRIARFAFEHAARHGRRRVTCLHKANIMKLSDGLFLDCFRKVAAEHAAIEARELIADNGLMQLVLDPGRFDVVLAGNMIGDIVSDLCAGLVGGPGAVPGINVGDGDVVVFEAIHGNAPHLEGLDRANPMTLLIAAIEMLRHLGEGEAAARIMTGVERTLTAGREVTPDLGGTAHTSGMAQAIIEAMDPAPRDRT